MTTYDPARNTGSTLMIPRPPRQPWEVISIDLMGPFPRKSRGKQYLLVATDLFSRWTEAYPLGTATTKTITETLEREFFSRFGDLRACLSDNGSQFVANDMRKEIERWGAEGWTTPVYHPRVNPVERRNQEVKKGLLTLLIDGNHNTWYTKLASILFSIRIRCNDRTGYPSSVLVLGKRANGRGTPMPAPRTATVPPLITPKPKPRAAAAKTPPAPTQLNTCQRRNQQRIRDHWAKLWSSQQHRLEKPATTLTTPTAPPPRSQHRSCNSRSLRPRSSSRRRLFEIAPEIRTMFVLLIIVNSKSNIQTCAPLFC
ncbi:hypothetical protein QTP88_006756 [Uroleucon formosanum]